MSGTVGETTLSVAQIANHTHVINSDMTYRNAANIASKCLNYIVGEQSEATGGSQPHTHALSGASGEASTLPPYYALALIMRIA